MDHPLSRRLSFEKERKLAPSIVVVASNGDQDETASCEREAGCMLLTNTGTEEGDHIVCDAEAEAGSAKTNGVPALCFSQLQEANDGLLAAARAEFICLNSPRATATAQCDREKDSNSFEKSSPLQQHILRGDKELIETQPRYGQREESNEEYPANINQGPTLSKDSG